MPQPTPLQDNSGDSLIKFCPFCRAKTNPSAKFCFSCGKNLESVRATLAKNMQQQKETTPPKPSQPPPVSSPSLHPQIHPLDEPISRPPATKPDFIVNKPEQNEKIFQSTDEHVRPPPPPPPPPPTSPQSKSTPVVQSDEPPFPPPSSPQVAESSHPITKPEFNEELATAELITRSRDPRKGVSIFVGQAPRPEDANIVIIECPSCGTKISSAAAKCYSCLNVLDKEKVRMLVDEQKKIKQEQKRIAEERKKDELKNRHKLRQEQLKRSRELAAKPQVPQPNSPEHLSPEPRPVSEKASMPEPNLPLESHKTGTLQDASARPVSKSERDMLTDGLIKCPGCSTLISADAPRCYACGKQLKAELPPKIPVHDDIAEMTPLPERALPPPKPSSGKGVTIICDQGHVTECDSGAVPSVCPTCGSRKLTFALGKLKQGKGAMFGSKGGVSQVSFKKGGRMEELDRQYGNKF